jgi:hypothetical protein
VKASVKYLDGVKWKMINAKEFVGNSIAHYIKNSDKVCVGALLDDSDTPCFFVTNNTEQYDKYKDKAFTIMAEDLLILLGEECLPSTPLVNVALKVFPDLTFKEIEPVKKDDKKWW